MSVKVQKTSSSVPPTSSQKKSHSLLEPRTFSVPPKSDTQSSPKPEMPSYSRAAADALYANVMRSMEAKEQRIADVVMPKPESATTSGVAKTGPSQNIGIQRQCSECQGEEKGADEKASAVGVQAKLTVGAPGDKYEQEAERVAAQVMSMPVAPNNYPQVQRFGEEDNPVQRWSLAQSITPVVQRRVDEQVQMPALVQRAFPSGGTQASGDLENHLNASKGGGSPLAPEVRSFMEPRFGADFSSVRVHTGSDAVQMNRALGAQAFTHGSDIYYGGGKAPGNNDLTAHELTHVVQQVSNSQLQRQASGILAIQRFSWDGTASETACTLLSDEQIYQLFVEVYFSSQPNARAHLVHYRYGGGSVYKEDVEALFTANPRIRTRIAQLIEQQIADGTATIKGSLVGRGVDDGSDPPIRQSDYDSEDWHNANGNIDRVDWEIIGSYKPNDYNHLQITVIDPYEWHPAEGRPTKCLHAAFERLKTKGAADYITQGTASLILPPTQQSPDTPLESDW